MARQHQTGRVASSATNVATHKFTEGWFRNSGIYDLNPDYLLEHPERVEEDSEREIASDLGVSYKTVQRAKQQITDGKLGQVSQLTTDDKRDLVRDYCDDNPDASNREVAH